MKRFTATETGMLIMSTGLLMGGLYALIFPYPILVDHYNDGFTGGPPGNYREVVTKDGARIYGGLCVVLGIGLGAWVIVPRKR